MIQTDQNKTGKVVSDVSRGDRNSRQLSLFPNPQDKRYSCRIQDMMVSKEVYILIHIKFSLVLSSLGSIWRNGIGLEAINL